MELIFNTAYQSLNLLEGPVVKYQNLFHRRYLLPTKHTNIRERKIYLESIERKKMLSEAY